MQSCILDRPTDEKQVTGSTERIQAYKAEKSVSLFFIYLFFLIFGGH